jgi:hypothetical protein
MSYLTSFSSTQFEIVQSLASPIPPAMRDDFLRELSRQLRGRDCDAIGEAELHRAAVRARELIMPRRRMTEGQVISGR